MSLKPEARIEKGELLRKSGISPADLHNWVGRGLLPRWCGCYYEGGGGSRYYYPAWAVNRASDIKRLRKQGYSMQEIRKILPDGRLEL